MERAEEDRKQLCESPAHYTRLEKSWRQDQYVYPFSDQFWESQYSCGGDGKATVPHRHSFAAIAFLHLLEVWKKPGVLLCQEVLLELLSWFTRDSSNQVCQIEFYRNLLY